MPSAHELICLPAEARPFLLEGRWLGEAGEHAWAAANPISILEGSRDALERLPAWLDLHARNYPEGAAVGFLSYELARHFEPVDLATLASLPDICFAYYPQIESIPDATFPPPRPAPSTRIHSNFDLDEYRHAVERVREYIQDGDIYQANVTVQFQADMASETPEAVYARMRSGSAPFRAFIKTPERTILSNSPERFFRVTGNHILASPIKGTAARASQNPAGTIAQLLSSPKDRAENLMIVDLLRNDLGRICRYESIRARLWDIEILPQLLHLVSHVEGTLRPGVGVLEILRALFPCGSITGAPKIRAMELLAEIEPAARGVSMGAIGIIRGASGSERCRMDFNVAIRTMVIEKGTACFNVGGGIVYDSDPASEYREVMLKAQPLFEALGALAAPVWPSGSPAVTPTQNHGLTHLP